LFSILAKNVTSSQLQQYAVGEEPNWAIVTGASEGIGKEFALQLADAGYSIILMSRSRDKLEKVALEIASKPRPVQTLIYPFDFSKYDASLYESLKVVLQPYNICILVNNVGIAPEHPTSFLDEDPQQCRNVVQVNASSQLEMTRLILPKMKQKRSGLILNIGSFAGQVPCGLLATYR
jgi:17beta-estradiol 17-dehydrogenase / very-long-chain 3-oxoacyl-CoA reductase